MKTIAESLAVLILLSALAGCASPTEGPVGRPPNIVFILADDLGYGELGSYGQELIETPNLDTLASNGIRFTQHYSGSPVCAPSRYVLLTGRHSGHAYIRGNDEWGDRGDVWDFAKAVEDPNLEGQRPLPAGTTTIGTLLQSAGYRTAVVGKWGLGGPLTDGVPNKQGFDFFYGYNCQRQAHTFFPRHLWRNTEKVWLDNELVVPGTKLAEGADPLAPESYRQFYLEDYSPESMLSEAVSFIEENREQPFFLYFATPIPHAPLQAPADWVQKYVDKFGDEEPYLGDRGYFPHRYPRAAYAAMVSYLDDQVGQLVQKLEELGLRENTVIFFTSDNGPTYNGGTDSPFFDSARPFKSEQDWGKGTLREGGIRVPMIVNWPGTIERSKTTGHISAFYDVLPTLCELAGIPVPEGVDGTSFLSVLRGEESQVQHPFLYWEFPSYGGQQAVRMGDWKGIRRDIFKDNLDIELYNLVEDPREQMNVAAQHPGIVDEIRAIMEREHVPAEVDRFKIKQLGD
ncbi:MAG: arylsulfatase [Acidobacteriota bacterium]|nr:MAG: arylsulfatase [Acidobacteriota bacterium]